MMEEGRMPEFSDYAVYVGVFLAAAILAYTLAVFLDRFWKRRIREEAGLADEARVRETEGIDHRTRLREDVLSALQGPDQWDLRRLRIESSLLRLGAEPGPFMMPAIECYGKLSQAGRDRHACLPVLEEIQRWI